MPRQGSGEVINDNSIEPGAENLTHGAPAGNESSTGSGVDRSGKAAPAPDHEAGEGLKNEDGSAASSGQASITGGSGKGPL